MNSFRLISRLLARPTALWVLFATVVGLSAAGLSVLSRHALELSRQREVSERREDLQQDLRVALWRLDSRLGPYIATLHDPVFQDKFSRLEPDQYVLQRFAITRDHRNKGGGFRFTPTRTMARPQKKVGTIASKPKMTGNSATSSSLWKRLQDTIAVNAIVKAVDQLIPPDAILDDQPLVQAYPSQMNLNQMQQAVVPDQRRSQVALSNRFKVVQQQLDFNTVVSNLSVPRAEQRQDIQWMSVWIDEHLVVVRSSRSDVRELEGVWVDWPRLRESLVGDIIDLVPGASIHAVEQDDEIDPARTLAAIPAMIDPHKIVSASDEWSPTHTALSFTWFAFLGSALIASVALSRVIALSERRAAFVSAVTHELRTPLTTFRLYSDLLARGMVSDAKDRKEYFETLQREADRLTHLVDNVLRYSKLQQISKAEALETVTLSQWVSRIAPRLESRLTEADMTLVVDLVSDGLWSTDPPAMEQALFNLIDNAAKYGQSENDRRVHLQAGIQGTFVVFKVTDHGPGVPPSLRATIFKPFAKSAQRAAETAAGVGLGLALAKQTANSLGGSLAYQPTQGGGASFLLRVPQGQPR